MCIEELSEIEALCGSVLWAEDGSSLDVDRVVLAGSSSRIQWIKGLFRPEIVVSQMEFIPEEAAVRGAALLAAHLSSPSAPSFLRALVPELSYRQVMVATEPFRPQLEQHQGLMQRNWQRLLPAGSFLPSCQLHFRMPKGNTAKVQKGKNILYSMFIIDLGLWAAVAKTIGANSQHFSNTSI
jgi:molecular chaperone DnaK (HSP70)